MDRVTSAEELSWVGSDENFVDNLNVQKVKHIVVGRFGGNSSAGQYKNEDGCVVWVHEELDSEFVVLLDAHHSAESAELVVDTINSFNREIRSLLNESTKRTFTGLQNLLIATFESNQFREACRNVQGETAFLCVVRKGKFLWWFSVGDCILYLNHPELAKLNEFQQNHRSFYEWIGKVNTFNQEVPCFSTGTKELREGKNHIFLTTDGLVECPNVNFGDPATVLQPFIDLDNEEGVRSLLTTIKENHVRDSTTILSWFVEVDRPGSQPSVT